MRVDYCGTSSPITSMAKN